MKWKGRRQSKNVEDRRGWARADTNPTPFMLRDPTFTRPSGRSVSGKGPSMDSDKIIGGPQYTNRGQAMTVTEKPKKKKK